MLITSAAFVIEFRRWSLYVRIGSRGGGRCREVYIDRLHGVVIS
jgi:hypothetical protein